MLVSKKEEAAAVIVVAAGARHNVNRAVARQAGRDIEVDGRELELLHDLLRHLKDHARVAGDGDARAVHRHPAISHARNCLESGAEKRNKDAIVVEAGRVRDARFQFCQFEEVPAVERQVFDLLATDEAAHLMAFGVDQCGGGIHRYLFAHRADLESEVEGGSGPGLDGGRTFQKIISYRFCRDVVITWRQQRCVVIAFSSGGHISA